MAFAQTCLLIGVRWVFDERKLADRTKRRAFRNSGLHGGENSPILRPFPVDYYPMKTLFLALTAALLSPLAFAQESKVEITANDQMQFSTKAFEVKAGDKVTLTLKHVGQMQKIAMGHNVVILQKGTEVPAFAMKSTTAKDSDYIPQDAETKGKVIAHTKLLGGGESDTITFDAPKEAGTYPFLCTFPGHFALMQGTMTVK